MSQSIDSQEVNAKLLSELDDNYRIIMNMRPLPDAAVRRYYEEYSISNSYNSNAIEGNTFTYDETRLLIKEGVTCSSRSFREHEEIVGYKRAFDYLYNAVKTSVPITEEFIKTLHSFVLADDSQAGVYRNVPVYIGDGINVAYTPFKPKELLEAMAKFTREMQEDMLADKALITSQPIDWSKVFHDIAKHHIDFERIHPFIDGNGRTGRLLMSYEMITLGLLPVDIRYEERERYYAGFKDYDKKEKYSDNFDSRTKKMAKLLLECELHSMNIWNTFFDFYRDDQQNNDKN